MLTLKCAITQANRTYILKGSLLAVSCLRKLNLISQKRIGFAPSILTEQVRPCPACWSEFLNGRLMPEIVRLTVKFRRIWGIVRFAEARGSADQA
jgi:hypothetical protein